MQPLTHRKFLTVVKMNTSYPWTVLLCLGTIWSRGRISGGTFSHMKKGKSWGKSPSVDTMGLNEHAPRGQVWTVGEAREGFSEIALASPGWSLCPWMQLGQAEWTLWWDLRCARKLFLTQTFLWVVIVTLTIGKLMPMWMQPTSETAAVNYSLDSFGKDVVKQILPESLSSTHPVIIKNCLGKRFCQTTGFFNWLPYHNSLLLKISSHNPFCSHSPDTSWNLNLALVSCSQERKVFTSCSLES